MFYSGETTSQVQIVQAISKTSILAAQVVLSVLATLAALGTIRLASVPFPLFFSPQAWAHYVVLAALVYFYFSLGSWVLTRFFRFPQNGSPAMT